MKTEFKSKEHGRSACYATVTNRGNMAMLRVICIAQMTGLNLAGADYPGWELYSCSQCRRNSARTLSRVWPLPARTDTSPHDLFVVK